MSAYKWTSAEWTCNNSMAESVHPLLLKVQRLLQTRGVVSAYEMSQTFGVPPEEIEALIRVYVESGQVIRLTPITNDTHSPCHIYYRMRCPDDDRYRWQQTLLVLSLTSRHPAIAHKT